MDYMNEDLASVGQMDTTYNLKEEENLEKFLVNLLDDCRQGRAKSCGSVLKIMMMNTNWTKSNESDIKIFLNIKIIKKQQSMTECNSLIFKTHN